MEANENMWERIFIHWDEEEVHKPNDLFYNIWVLKFVSFVLRKESFYHGSFRVNRRVFAPALQLNVFYLVVLFHDLIIW